MKTLASLVLFLVSMSNAYSCQFIWSFCETIQHHGTLVEAKIIEIGDTSIIFQVTEVLLNEDVRKIETIEWNVCKPDLCTPTGRTPMMDQSFLFVLDINNQEITSHHVIRRYSFCETFAVDIKDNMISFWTREGNKTIDYDDFKKEIGQICSLSELKEEVFFSSNPHNGEYMIKNQTNTSLACVLFDASGRVVNRFVLQGESDLTFFQNDLPAGMYFIRFSDGLRFTTKKFIKV